MQSNQCQLIEPHEPLVILVEYDMCSLLQFPPHFRSCFRLVINQSVGSCGEKLIPECLELSIRCLILKVISFILSTLYILCIVFWYYPLFVAICEIWLLKLTYGAYLVLSLKSSITIQDAPSSQSPSAWWTSQKHSATLAPASTLCPGYSMKNSLHILY